MVEGTDPHPRPRAGRHDEGSHVAARSRSSSRSSGPSSRTRTLWQHRLGITLVAAIVTALVGAVPSAAGPHPGVVVAPEVVQEASVAAGRTCEPIRVELCRSAVRGYNMTIMPNLAGHEFQKEAEGHLSTFAPLVQYGCSSQLLLFLCAVLVPMCTDQVDQVEAHAQGQTEVHVVAIGPCRGLCEAVRARCLPVMLNFSYPWPPHLDCARFPTHNSPAHMCMEGPGEDDDLEDDGDVRGFPLVVAAVPEHAASPTRPAAALPLPARCLPAEAVPHSSRADKQMAEVWLSIWSGLCFVSSVLALLTLRLGPGGPGAPGAGQAQGPGPSARGPGARAAAGPSPLASLALSYGLLSVGWGIRVLAGRATSASASASTSTLASVAAECDASDLRNPNCAAVFLLTYFFGTASIIWWVVLAAVWCLSAGLRVSPSSLQRHSYLFHLAGWGVPAALTLAVLVLRDVAAEPLTGACQVGPTWSTVFVLAPQCSFLCMGLLFLALGALTQWRSKPPPAPQALLWPLAAERLGLLAGLCALPLAVMVATHALELGSSATSGLPHLSLRLFQVRLVASLVVGVAAPFWVWPGERPWPPCPPWPRPPRAWRYPGVGKGAAAASSSMASSGAPGVGPSAATTAPLLPSSGSAASTVTSRPPSSALLGPALPAPGPVHCPVPVHGAGGAGGGPTRTRGSSGSRSRGASNKHYRKHHGSETTV